MWPFTGTAGGRPVDSACAAWADEERRGLGAIGEYDAVVALAIRHHEVLAAP